jgi:GT2 family glycosyltransferase
MSAVTLSIIIVNWNTASLLRDCLSSIRQHPFPGAFEVIVVDNASSDESAAIATTEFPEFLTLAETKNHGYARGNNIGISASSGEFVLTLNPDTRVTPDLLRNTVETLRAKGKSYGCLSIRFEGPDGETQKSVRGFPTIRGILGDLFKVAAWDTYRLNNFDYTTSQDAPQPMGTFLLFRRSSFPDPIKPFDEQFPIFFNEVDLLKRLNGKCWYEASLTIHHLGGASTKQTRKPMIWESHRSLIRYLFKHTTGLARISLYPISVIIWLGAFVRARGFSAGFRP